MMIITINGKECSLDDYDLSVQALLHAHGFDGKIVAVARNGNFLPKGAYDSTPLQNGDEIEIVAPMQGG